MLRNILIGIALLAIVVGGTHASLPAFQEDRSPDVVYVGTPYDVVAAMLRMARVKTGDVVLDLGCGDGRMVVLAAQKYGCRGIGYDIDPERVGAARLNAVRNGVDHLVSIAQADLFTLEFGNADVLSLYLLPEINDRLVPKLKKLKPGTRLVFHNYGLSDMEPDSSVEIISNEDNASHTVFLYTTPLKPAK